MALDISAMSSFSKYHPNSHSLWNKKNPRILTDKHPRLPLIGNRDLLQYFAVTTCPRTANASPNSSC
jgi:hypothetical protein